MKSKAKYSLHSSFFIKPFVILLGLLLLYNELISPVNGYSMKYCTIKSSLQNPVRVNCYKRKLSAVPENIPSKTEALDVSHNRISVIKRGDLLHLTCLWNLNASNNHIQDVVEGAFSSLITLKELNLAHNKLRTIRGRFFQKLLNLTVLRLDNNFITNIEVSAFQSLNRLITVNLSQNNLQNMYKVQPLFTLPNLECLYIGHNGLMSFETQDVSNTSLKLKILDVSQNPLHIFRITADVFPSLETLDLSFLNRRIRWDVRDKHYLGNVSKLILNGIQMPFEVKKSLLQTFNTSLAGLELETIGEKEVKRLVKAACLINKLEFLRLAKNNISSISEEEFKHCTNLKTLDLAHNTLNNITRSAFRSISKLSELWLGHNNLQSVPTAISELFTLETLDLSYNAITALKCTDLANLTQLSKLYIYRNYLESVENCTFEDLKNLDILEIGSNRLLTMKGYLSNSLQNVTYVEFSQNKLNSIKKSDLQSLLSVKDLHLNDNQIQFIEPGAFERLRNLIVLNLQSNKLTQTSITASVFSGLSNLQQLNLNNNYISYSSQKSLKEPPFVSLISLDALYIYSQHQKGMLNIPSNFLKGLKSLKLFCAGNLNIRSVHPQTFIHTPNLWYLDFSKNDLISFSPELFVPIKNLNRLYLIKTGLKSLDFLIKANVSEIRYLQISKNTLSVINKTVIDSLPKLLYIDLQLNTFVCDCSNAWFVDWAVSNNDTQVIKADQFVCNYPDKFRGHKLLDLNVGSCNVDVGFFCFVSTTTLVSLTLLSSFLFHFLKWQVTYAYYLLLAYLYDSKQQKKRKPNGFQYDAFISYNTHDELWVMRELLPQLEGEQGWRLCLHHRDFEPGKPIMDNIVDGIYNSRKTICVISRHYLESEWCSREIQVASFRLFDEKKDVLILVFLENIPSHQLSPYYRMRRLIKKRTYLSWPKAGEDTKVFWRKLRVALGSTTEEESSLFLGVV